MTTYNKPPGSGPKRIQDIQRENANSQGKNVTRKTVIQQFAPVQQPSGGPAVTGVSPIAVAGNAVSIATASASGAGAVAAADFSTFAAKEPGLGNPGVSGYLLSSTTGGVRSWVAPGGGGSSPYTLPVLADFTIANAPVGATATDTTTCLLLATPSSGGGSGTLFALEDNAAPGATFTLTAGADQMFTGNTGWGVFVADGTGKVFQWGVGAGAAVNGNLNYWNSYTSFDTNVSNTSGYNATSRFIKLVYDGTNFNCYTGMDLNSQMLIHPEIATLWIAAPVVVGIYIYGASGPINGSFFHYSHV